MNIHKEEISAAFLVLLFLAQFQKQKTCSLVDQRKHLLEDTTITYLARMTGKLSILSASSQAVFLRTQTGGPSVTDFTS